MSAVLSGISERTRLAALLKRGAACPIVFVFVRVWFASLDFNRKAAGGTGSICSYLNAGFLDCHQLARSNHLFDLEHCFLWFFLRLTISSFCVAFF